MANKLQTMIPALFQPTDPAMPGDGVAAEADSGPVGRLTAFAAVVSALAVVGLIAVLMGMT